MSETLNLSPPAWLPQTVGAPTILDAVDSAAAWRGDHPAIVENRRCLTYRQMAVEMRQVGAAFVRAGLQPGDRVAIWLQNGIDWVRACLGVQAAGGVVVPVNTRFKGFEAGHVINKPRARFLVHASSFLGIDFLALLRDVDTPTLERAISVPTAEASEAEFDSFVASGAEDPNSLLEVERRLSAVKPTDIADIMFTSGTTGTPKGVVANHGQNVRVGFGWIGANTLCETDRFSLIWPFFHCGGYKAGWLASTLAGATVYPESNLDIDRLIDRVVREEITVLPGPPTLFQALLALPDDRRNVLRQHLRVAGTGATVTDPALIVSMRENLGLAQVWNGYGLTESCGTVTMTAADDPPELVATTVGKAIPETEVRVKDPSGHLLPLGSEGEVVVRGYNVMQGYFEDPQATSDTIDADGWLHTGDLGVVDARGYLRLTGRKKEIYIVGGFNCYPAEIENLMRSHSSVADVAIVGVPDARLGEVGKAFVIRDCKRPRITADELIAWCRTRMANFKVPREIVFVDELPRTATGKVQKFRLTAGEFG